MTEEIDFSAKFTYLATNIGMVIYWGDYYCIQFMTTYATNYIFINLVANQQKRFFGKPRELIIGGVHSVSLGKNMCRPMGQLCPNTGESPGRCFQDNICLKLHFHKLY